MITVCVYWEQDGKPVKDAKVTVIMDGMFGGSIEGFTNRDGEVDLDVKPNQGRIFLGNKEVYKGEISGRKAVYK